MSTLTSVAVVMAATLGGEPDGVILDFSATWCEPCRQMMPIVKRLQQQGYPIRKVDYDRERALANRFRVTDLPTFVLIVRGKEQQRNVGSMSESQLRRMAQRIPARAPKPVSKPKPEPASKVESATPASELGPIFRANNGEPPKTGEVSKNPIPVCVRIRVRDSKGLDIGSGTIIHSEPGRTLVLTCGHIFRHLDDESRIEVDVFDDGRAVSHEGRLIRRDLKADIGLISIKTLTPLRVARVSPDPIRQGQHVFSVGCGGGEPPSRLQHRVTSTTRYKGGYIECTGTPIQGRSGGGLFTPDGKVVGLCVFANPGSRRGLYTGLETIHGLLDRVGLTSLYRDGPSASPIQLVGAESPATKSSDEPKFEEVVPGDGSTPDVQGLELEPAKSGTAPSLPVAPDAQGQSGIRSSPKPLSDSVRQALREARGNEVVCIIRSRNNPNAPSRVIIIHEASEQFVSELTGELYNQLRPTSVEVRREGQRDDFAVPVPSVDGFFGRTQATMPLPVLPKSPSVTGPLEGVRRYQRNR